MAYISVINSTWQLKGDFIVESASTILEESAAIPMESTALDIDFSGVSNVDTTALALILAWQRRAKEEYCRINFRNMPKSLASLATLYGVEAFLFKH